MEKASIRYQYTMFSTYVARKNNKFIPKKYHNRYVTRKEYILIILYPKSYQAWTMVIWTKTFNTIIFCWVIPTQSSNLVNTKQEDIETFFLTFFPSHLIMSLTEFKSTTTTRNPYQKNSMNKIKLTSIVMGHCKVSILLYMID